jgi:hypothetical protein
MNYYINRGGQIFGPYTFAQLQQHFQTGHIVPSDLAQGEGMPNWVPIGQILGSVPAQPATPYGGQPAGYGAAPAGQAAPQPGYGSPQPGYAPVAPQVAVPPAGYVPATPGYGGASIGYAAAPAPVPHVAHGGVPLPADLNWILLLVLNALTSVFNLIWSIYLANWARKLDGQVKHVAMMWIYVGVSVVALIALVGSSDPTMGMILFLVAAIFYLVGVFGIKAAMEQYYNSTENVGLKLSPVMTFFFSTIYFQYHINKLHRWKNTGVYQ